MSIKEWTDEYDRALSEMAGALGLNKVSIDDMPYPELEISWDMDSESRSLDLEVSDMFTMFAPEVVSDLVYTAITGAHPQDRTLEAWRAGAGPEYLEEHLARVNRTWCVPGRFASMYVIRKDLRALVEDGLLEDADVRIMWLRPTRMKARVSNVFRTVMLPAGVLDDSISDEARRYYLYRLVCEARMPIPRSCSEWGDMLEAGYAKHPLHGDERVMAQLRARLILDGRRRRRWL